MITSRNSSRKVSWGSFMGYLSSLGSLYLVWRTGHSNRGGKAGRLATYNGNDGEALEF